MNERVKIEYVVGNKSFYGLEIRKKGNVNVQMFHRELIPWFNKYYYDFHEKNLTGRDVSSGREEKIEWGAERKVDSYFKFHIDAEILVWRWKGEKAEITVRFKGYLEKDYRNRFSIRYGNKFGDFLRKLYERYVIKDRIDKMIGKVYTETNAFIDNAKEVLNLMVK